MRNKIFIWIFLAILCLPVFQSFTRVFPRPKLHGVEWISQNKRLSYQNIINGDFQDNFTKWFNQRIGFRSYFIKSYNQFYYSFFNWTPNTDIVIGKNGQLYLQDYITRYYAKSNDDYTLLAESIGKLKKVQDIFNEKGIILILLISPNKASVYPEGIPESLKTSETDLNAAYKNTVMLLDKYNVNYIDGHKIFMEQKNNSEYNLFSKGGIHWNYYGASLVINKLLDKVESLGKKDLTKIGLSHIDLDDYAKGKENDLALLLNLWTDPTKETYPHPRFQRIAGKNEFKPNTLIVGNSFSELIAELLFNYDITGNLSRFYYYSSYTNYTAKKNGEIEWLDWNKDIFKRDLIIVEINEGLWPGENGFTDDALTIMEAHNIGDMDFAYKNEKHVESFLLNDKLRYRLKKGASAPAIFLKSSKIHIEDYMKYATASFIAKDFEKIKCDLYPGELLSAAKTDISDEYKQYTYIFKTSGTTTKNHELSFFVDGDSVTDKDTYIYDIKLYSTRH